MSELFWFIVGINCGMAIVYFYKLATDRDFLIDYLTKLLED